MSNLVKKHYPDFWFKDEKPKKKKRFIKRNVSIAELTKLAEKTGTGFPRDADKNKTFY